MENDGNYVVMQKDGNWVLTHCKELRVTDIQACSLGLFDGGNYPQSCNVSKFLICCWVSLFYFLQTDWSVSLHTMSSKTFFKHNCNFYENLGIFHICMCACACLYIFIHIFKG